MAKNRKLFQRLPEKVSGLKNRIKRTLKSCQGMTLVELVVTFALLSLFAVSTCMMLASAIKVYHQIRGLNNAMQVSDTLMDKIVGEIEGAQVGSATGSLIHEDKTLKIAADGTYLDLYDYTGSPIRITTTDHGSLVRPHDTYAINQLLIYYYPVIATITDSEGNDIKNTLYKAVDWTYDKSAYMGFEIHSLTFAQADPDGIKYPRNVLKVILVLNSSRYGSFTSERYVECYNFSSEEALEKILVVSD